MTFRRFILTTVSFLSLNPGEAFSMEEGKVDLTQTVSVSLKSQFPMGPSPSDERPSTSNSASSGSASTSSSSSSSIGDSS